jgi:GNAT superfamily N-acetyltransferase
VGNTTSAFKSRSRSAWNLEETFLSNPLSFRLARRPERARLEALQMRASLNNHGDRAALLANPDAITLPDQQIEAGQVVVAELDGRIVGFASVLPRADGDSELDALFVEPDKWRNGIGGALIAQCIAMARAQDSTILHVIGNPHAAAFYSACGFEQSGTHPTRFGVGLLFQKKFD